MNDRLSLWLKVLHPAWFVVLLVFASFVIIVPFMFLATVFPIFVPGPGSSGVKHGAFVQIALGVMLAPLLETALFQALPIELLSRKTSFRWQTNVLVSSVLFGAAHRYSWGYVLATFLVGVVFAYGYAVRRRERGRPFLLVFLAHALRNSMSLAVIALGALGSA